MPLAQEFKLFGVFAKELTKKLGKLCQTESQSSREK
jgi:hypothetical protein